MAAEQDLFSSQIIINIQKALTSEYNETVSAELIQYVKDEEFDQDTLTSDICDDEELENCSIAIHLIEEFPNIFESNDNQQKLLLVLKNVINGKSMDKESMIKIIFCDDKSGEIDYNQGIMKTFPCHSTLKSIAQNFEDEIDAKDDNAPYIHIWIRFGSIKSIYSINNNKFEVRLDDLKYENHKRWVEIPDDYLSKLRLNDILSSDSLQFENILLIEKKQKNGIWPRVKQKNWNHGLFIGDIIDAKPIVANIENNKLCNKWYEAMIRYIYPDGHQNAWFGIIHFIGFNIKYDEMLFIRDRDHIAPRYTHCNGPYRKPGVTNSDLIGLINLGNTSFINSILQPIVRCNQLTEYFINNEYMSDINNSNPLGWNGRIAKQYGILINNIFGGKQTLIDIRDFKSVIIECAPRFAGYQQHDAFEFLLFLLDGLHEDLNQIYKKPFIQSIESDDRPNEIIAVEQYKLYLKRNESEINDIFHYQYREKIVCKDCGKIYIQFHSQNILSLEIPNSNKLIIKYTWINCGTFIIPKKYAIKISKYSNILILKQIVANKHSVPMEELFICEIYENKIRQQFNNNDKIEIISINMEHDIFIYNVPAPNINKNNNISNDDDDVTFTVNNKRRVSNSDSFIGFPLLITLSLNLEMTYKQIRYELWHIIKPYLYDKLNINDKLPFKLMAKWGNNNNINIEIIDCDEIFEYLKASNFEFLIYWNDVQQYNVYPYYKTETKYDDNCLILENEMRSLNQSIHLLQCFNFFNKEEILIDDCSWYCSYCKQFKIATKKLNLWTCSDALIIHFNRFIQNGNHRETINTKIEFPLNGLDLSPYLLCHDAKIDAIYDCYGITIHSGNTGGGHWTCYAKSLYNNQWYYFDDTKVNKVDNPNNYQQFNYNAHILYYQKRKQRQTKQTFNTVKLSGFKIKY